MPARRTPIAAVVSLALAACDQPLRPANPAPMEIAAKHFDVPVSTLLELQRIADRVQPPESGLSRPDPSSAQALRLKEIAAAQERTRSVRPFP